MKVQVNMINVEDGDAIIIGLENEFGERALITIDGGYKTHYSKRVRPRLLELLPEYGGRIRLMICTHYDNDHLAGAREIVKDFHDVIDEIWMHKIDQPLSEQIEEMKSSYNALVESIESNKTLKSINNWATTAQLKMIEGYPDLIDFLQELKDFGLEDKIKEATRGKKLKRFEDFEVIAPTPEYYNEYLNQLKGEKFFEDLKYNQLSDTVEYTGTVDGLKILEQIEQVNPCEALETKSVPNGVTPTNMVSIVCLLTANDKKFLFTGDAGIESFEDNNLLDDQIKDLFWLDVPHHGSKNNTSAKMLAHFNPEITFVSGKANSKRPHTNIVNCLKTRRTGGNQFVSNAPANTWYLQIDEKGKILRK